MSEPSTHQDQLLVVDSHVHLYDWLNLRPMLDNALAAFTQAAEAYKNSGDFAGILVLTEPAGRDTFARLRTLVGNEAKGALGGPWRLEATAEDLSLSARHTAGAAIYLISGQQTVTRENLEVLALFSPQSVPERASLAETIKAVEARGGYPVLPWGVGKWLFGRGKQVSRVIAASDAGALAIGDNGGRPGFWSHVPQFAEALRHNLPLLHGSDPLPVSETRRSAGSNGDILVCPFDPARPGASLVAALRANRCERVGYGRPESALNFLKDQIALRLG